MGLHDQNIEPAGNPSPTARIEFDGFSILPPQGAHWIESRKIHAPIVGRLVSDMEFIKVLPQRNPEGGVHTVVAAVESWKFNSTSQPELSSKELRQEFLNFRRQWQIENDRVQTEAAAGTQRLISQKAVVDTSLGYDCVRYDLIGETQRVPGFEGRPFYVDFHTYECIDPAGRMVVKLTYSQRIPPNTAPVDITNEGEGFLKSLRFATPTS